jgi:beta-lactamase superfamily II metal-dependent hydrolase
MGMFRVELLPAQQGDALWIEYGEPESVHRILIDGGTPPSYQVVKDRIQALSATERHFELCIVTHVDTDHIGGALKLLADRSLGATFGDVWFNDQKVLPRCPDPRRSPIDGAILTQVLHGLGISPNGAFDGNAVSVPEQGELPVKSLAGGMRLTVLSPGTAQLAALCCNWTAALRKAGLGPGAPSAEELNERARRKRVEIPRAQRAETVEELASAPFVADRTRANGSTIAVLAEYKGVSCVLAGDAFARVLARSLSRLAAKRGERRVAVSAFKLPHHGSRRNTSVELLGTVACPMYLFSTDGSVFGHPDPEAVARVIRHGGPNPTLCFNYRSEPNKRWDDTALRERYSYQVRYPSAGQAGLTIDLASTAPPSTLPGPAIPGR